MECIFAVQVFKLRGEQDIYFLPHGMEEKTDSQVWSLDRGSAAHRCYEEKTTKPFLTFNRFCSTPPHSTPACVRGETKRGGLRLAVIVDWIKLKKDLFKRAKK